jgi:glyoxylase-like metal-dependent hydrolase (beta-lactamase superfamily II)
VVAIVCTHGHNDHINAALDVHGAAGAVPIALHDDDRMLWEQVHPTRGPDMPLKDEQTFDVGGATSG